MSRTEIIVLHCDRCPAVVERRDPADVMGWANFALALTAPMQAQLFEPIGTKDDKPAHLCVQCTAELIAWMTGADLNAKAAPPPAPERKRAALSLADVKELQDEITRLVCDLVTVARFTFVEANIADGHQPPIPIDQIENSVHTLVDGFVALHDLRKDGE